VETDLVIFKNEIQTPLDEKNSKNGSILKVLDISKHMWKYYKFVHTILHMYNLYIQPFVNFHEDGLEHEMWN